MKFALRQTGWSIEGGRTFIPQGTVIDTDAGTDGFSRLVASLGLTPPVNAQPLNQATWDLMRLQYPASAIFTIPGLGGDGINRT
jgi:hypothetical protein